MQFRGMRLVTYAIASSPRRIIVEPPSERVGFYEVFVFERDCENDSVIPFRRLTVSKWLNEDVRPGERLKKFIEAVYNLEGAVRVEGALSIERGSGGTIETLNIEIEDTVSEAMLHLRFKVSLADGVCKADFVSLLVGSPRHVQTVKDVFKALNEVCDGEGVSVFKAFVDGASLLSG